MIWNEETAKNFLGSLIWNTSEYFKIPLKKFAPIIFRWMISSDEKK